MSVLAEVKVHGREQLALQVQRDVGRAVAVDVGTQRAVRPLPDAVSLAAVRLDTGPVQRRRSVSALQRDAAEADEVTGTKAFDGILICLGARLDGGDVKDVRACFADQQIAAVTTLDHVGHGPRLCRSMGVLAEVKVRGREQLALQVQRDVGRAVAVDVGAQRAVRPLPNAVSLAAVRLDTGPMQCRGSVGTLQRNAAEADEVAGTKAFDGVLIYLGTRSDGGNVKDVGACSADQQIAAVTAFNDG